MPATLTPYQYFAFISYSRKDSKAAAWLQRRLEWFRFPVKLVPEDRRPPYDRYVRPIYRDKTNLEVTDEHYWTNIRRALDESRYLIVLCSEHAAASEPVNMEVAHFLATHGGDASHLAPVIVSGNVTSDGEDAALCPALRALGDRLITRNLPTMVPDGDATEPEAWEQGFVSLASSLLKLERRALGDHIQCETKRQARERLLRRVLLGTSVVIALAISLFWLAAKRDAEKASAANLRRRHDASMADYALAVQRIEKEGKWHEGVAHLARALEWEPANSAAAIRLYATLSIYAQEKQEWPRQILRHEDTLRSTQFSPDGSRIVTASADNTAQVWDAATGKSLGEPLRHQDVVWSAKFSADGSRIVTASEDHTTRVWDISKLKSPPVPVPVWMLERACAIAGMEFIADGRVRAVSQEVRRDTILSSPPGNDAWSHLARWLALPANERTLTPDSKFTCRQIAERERDSGFKEGIESSLRYDPTVPLSHVLLAKFEENPQRADFLRGYGLKLLPDDATLWVRAAASLVEQKNFKRALLAADKALSLDSNNADAHKARGTAIEGVKAEPKGSPN